MTYGGARAHVAVPVDDHGSMTASIAVTGACTHAYERATVQPPSSGVRIVGDQRTSGRTSAVATPSGLAPSLTASTIITINLAAAHATHTWTWGLRRARDA